MTWNRRNFLAFTGLGALATGVLANLKGCAEEPAANQVVVQQTTDNDDWAEVRNQFVLDQDYIHLAGLLITSHPTPVREAIDQYRQELDDNPAVYLEENNTRLEAETRQAAADYLGVQSNEVALTDSTTMGIALAIAGMQIRSDQEMLTARYDYYSTHESLRYKANRTGATMRKIPLYETIHQVSEDEIVDTSIGEVRSQTRLVTATWVHSSTGLKVPVRRIADRLEQINGAREESDRVLLLVDGVHGLGVEDATMNDLNCDFFMAGTHKWMFAPRGTGILWGNPRSQAAVSPTIPTFTRGAGWGGRMTPGGFKPFEHLWAMAEAFRFHQQIGRSRVSDRIHSLSRQLKEGLAQMPHITLYTPMEENLSAGIVCFDVDGFGPRQVVDRLRQQNIVASDTPYSPSHVRLTPGVYNTPEEMDRALSAIRDLG
ncbi:aminotransferase class V-fold PLP-dependent enzyme [Pleurocapsales cyanobacterium LEGE 06147]|nr:aminotransferase class V-fold PLP-dependent enzyme [Pleurocapsales cyanobacterium LEGE 06147]